MWHKSSNVIWRDATSKHTRKTRFIYFLAETLIIFQCLIWIFCEGLKWSECCYNLADVMSLITIWIQPICWQPSQIPCPFKSISEKDDRPQQRCPKQLEWQYFWITILNTIRKAIKILKTANKLPVVNNCNYYLESNHK